MPPLVSGPLDSQQTLQKAGHPGRKRQILIHRAMAGFAQEIFMNFQGNIHSKRASIA